MKLLLTDLLFPWSISRNLLALTSVNVPGEPCPQMICKHPGEPHATWLVGFVQKS